jgi:hypothetical protein
MDLGQDKQNVSFDGRTTEVVVRQKAGNRINGQFSAIGPLSNKKRTRGTMQQDIFDLLDNVSKGAFSVFNNLKFNRTEDNNVTRYASPEEMSKTDREVLSRRLKELKNVDIIRAVKKEIPVPGTDTVYRFKDPRRVFLINPDMIKCTNHDEAAYLWAKCNPKGES